MVPGIEFVKLYPEVGQTTWVELIRADATVPGIALHRELIDPSVYRSIRSLARVFNYLPEEHIPYSRNYVTGSLEEIAWDAGLHTGLTLILLKGQVGMDRLREVLARSRPGRPLPTRMIWPVY